MSSYVSLNDLLGRTLFHKKIAVFLMLAFIDIFNKIGSKMNVIKRKKLKPRNLGVTESRNDGVF